jgi:ABC-type nitrate/sulfonate/bicarbonate transport system ATPase subunit
MQIALQDIAYRHQRTAPPLFDHLDASLDGPGFMALFGISGVGKTTLARLISGELALERGTIRLHGIGRVLYSYNTERLPGWASVGEHLARVTPAPERPRLEQLIDVFGLRACLTSRFSQLSLGQQNRANLTRYLLQAFDLLVMDESLANVDEATRGEIILTIKALFPERLFLYISHSVSEVSRFCKQILVLRGAQRTPQAVMVRGQDLRRAQSLERSEHERTMLEIVHAA